MYLSSVNMNPVFIIFFKKGLDHTCLYYMRTIATSEAYDNHDDMFL